MHKVINPGSGRDGAVFCKIEYRKDGRLSISGVVGPMHNGNAKGSCGQIVGHLTEDVTTFEPGWSADLLARFEATWERWHLNDMRSGCAHQREWDTRRPLTLRSLTWGDAFHKKLRQAEAGTMPAEEYATWAETVRAVHALTIGYTSPKHPARWGAEGERMLAAQLVKPDKTEEKAAGSVTAAEHPDGLLSKACPTCGHKYGSGWLKEEVPADVLAFLASLPDTTVTPAWV